MLKRIEYQPKPTEVDLSADTSPFPLAELHLAQHGMVGKLFFLGHISYDRAVCVVLEGTQISLAHTHAGPICSRIAKSGRQPRSAITYVGLGPGWSLLCVELEEILALLEHTDLNAQPVNYVRAET